MCNLLLRISEVTSVNVSLLHISIFPSLVISLCNDISFFHSLMMSLCHDVAFFPSLTTAQCHHIDLFVYFSPSLMTPFCHSVYLSISFFSSLVTSLFAMSVCLLLLFTLHFSEAMNDLFLSFSFNISLSQCLSLSFLL